VSAKSAHFVARRPPVFAHASAPVLLALTRQSKAEKRGRLIEAASASLSIVEMTYQQGRHQHRYGPQALTYPGPHQRPKPPQAAC
jgi:hypothetical protein